MNISVFASGSGTNLQRIIDCIESGELEGLKIQSVIADRPCFALQRAAQNNIPSFQFNRKDKNFWNQVQSELPNNLDYIVLAGFLSIIPPEFVSAWRDKIINIHPSLLPKYGGKGMYGKHVHRAVLANNEKETGATVHFVNEGIDTGDIILQKSFKIRPCENVDWLATRVHKIEYEILIESLKKLRDEAG